MRIYSFDDVVGNFGTVSLIKSSIRNDSFPNFTLMSGDSGTGKSTCAEIASLSLNCENRIDENPCLECDSCKANLASLQGKGISSRVKKVNIGHKNDKDDVGNLINEIFKLEVSNGKSVFILEEVHGLPESGQTALLEEIDKLSENVYVILCTTKPRKLIEELRNRAIKFNFNSLKSNDSKILLDKLLNKNDYSMGTDIKDLILKESKGNPRKIVNLLGFLKNNPCTYNDVLDFLGEINPRLLAMLLRTADNTSSYFSYLNELLNDYSLDNLLIALKQYLLDLQFLSMGVSTYYTHTTQEDKYIASELGSEVIYKIQGILHSMNLDISDPDFMFNMMKIRSVIIRNRPSESNSIIEESIKASNNSSIERISDSSTFNETNNYSSAIESHITSTEKRESLKSINNNSLSSLTGDKLKEMFKK